MRRGIVSHLTSREYGTDNVRSLRALHGAVHHRNANCVAEDKAAVASKNKPCCQATSSKATFLIVFNKDGCKMASLHGDHTIKVTDVSSGRHLQTLHGHPRTPWAAAFHPASNDILATGCLAGEVRIWDLRSGTCDIWRAPPGSEIASLTFHPSEKILVIASGHNLFCWSWAIATEPVLLARTLRSLEKIRWVKFDPSGENIFTGITNSTLLEFRAPDSHRISESWSALREPPVRNELLAQQQRGNDGSDSVGTGRRAGLRPLSRHLNVIGSGSAEAAARSADAHGSGSAVPPSSSASSSSLTWAHGSALPRPSPYARRLSFDDDDDSDGSDGIPSGSRTVMRSGDPYLGFTPSSSGGPQRQPRATLAAANAGYDGAAGAAASSAAGSTTSAPQPPPRLVHDVYDHASGVARLAQLHNRRLGNVISTSAAAMFGSLEAAAASARAGSGTATGSGLRVLRQQILAATTAAAVGAASQPARRCANCLRTLARQGGGRADGSGSTTASVALPGRRPARADGAAEPGPSLVFSSSGPTLCTLCGQLASYQQAQPLADAGTAGQQRRVVPVDGGGSSSAAGSRPGRAPGSPPPWSAEGGAAGMLLADLRSRTHAQIRGGAAPAAAAATAAGSGAWRSSSGSTGGSGAAEGPPPPPRLPSVGAGAVAGSSSSLLSTLNQQRSDITAHLRELNNDLSVHQQTLQYHQERLNQIRERQQVLLDNLNRLQQLHDQEPAAGTASPAAGPPPALPPLEARPYRHDLSLLQQRADELRQRVHSRRLADVMVLPAVAAATDSVPSLQQSPLPIAGVVGNGAPAALSAASFLPEDVATAAFFSRTDYDVVQAAINRVLADAYRGRGEAAMASNIMNMSQRIQRWSFPDGVPAVLDEVSNLVIRNSKIHNDISVDISRDGSLLAAFVPSMQNSLRGFPEDMMLGVFSLLPETWCQCQYMKRFGPNAISVSLSPGNQYVLVGLAAKRLVPSFSPWQMVAQAFRLCKEQGGDESMRHVHDVMHPCSHEATRGYVSVNCALWLPHSGQGLAYGTNHGDLHLCLPGFAEPSSDDEADSWLDLERQSLRRPQRLLGDSRGSASSSSAAGGSAAVLVGASAAQRQSTGTQTVERSLL